MESITVLELSIPSYCNANTALYLSKIATFTQTYVSYSKNKSSVPRNSKIKVLKIGSLYKLVVHLLAKISGYFHDRPLIGHLRPDTKLFEYSAANSGASSSIIPSYSKLRSEIWKLWSEDAPSHSSGNLCLNSWGFPFCNALCGACFRLWLMFQTTVLKSHNSLCTIGMYMWAKISLKETIT